MHHHHDKPSERHSDLLQQALDRLNQGLAPPAEFYRSAARHKIDWSQLPLWARPIDPDVFDGCCHEG